MYYHNIFIVKSLWTENLKVVGDFFQMLAVLFFLSGCFWVFILRKNGAEQVYRIHWIMAALVFLKALSLLFHGINYNKVNCETLFPLSIMNIEHLFLINLKILDLSATKPVILKFMEL